MSDRTTKTGKSNTALFEMDIKDLDRSSQISAAAKLHIDNFKELKTQFEKMINKWFFITEFQEGSSVYSKNKQYPKHKTLFSNVYKFTSQEDREDWALHVYEEKCKELNLEPYVNFAGDFSYTENVTVNGFMPSNLAFIFANYLAANTDKGVFLNGLMYQKFATFKDFDVPLGYVARCCPYEMLYGTGDPITVETKNHLDYLSKSVCKSLKNVHMQYVSLFDLQKGRKGEDINGLYGDILKALKFAHKCIDNNELSFWVANEWHLENDS